MPPKLIRQIEPSSHFVTIGITGTRPFTALLKRQIDTAVAEIIYARNTAVRLIVSIDNRFGMNATCRACALRTTFSELVVVALTTPNAYAGYRNARDRNAENRLTRVFAGVDEVLLYTGKFPAQTIPEKHRIMAHACDLVLDGYAAKDVQHSRDLAAAVAESKVGATNRTDAESRAVQQGKPELFALSAVDRSRIDRLTGACEFPETPKPGCMAGEKSSAE